MSQLSNYVVFFDFDGVLGYGYDVYKHVLDEIYEMHQNGITMCIASFNCRAHSVLEYYGMDYAFSAWRCGYLMNNIETSKTISKSDPMLIKISKESQISSMLIELKEQYPMQNYNKVIFFDDNATNINETLFSAEFICWPVKINPLYGIPKDLWYKVKFLTENWTFVLTENIEKWNQINAIITNPEDHYVVDVVYHDEP